MYWGGQPSARNQVPLAEPSFEDDRKRQNCQNRSRVSTFEAYKCHEIGPKSQRCPKLTRIGLFDAGERRDHNSYDVTAMTSTYGLRIQNDRRRQKFSSTVLNRNRVVRLGQMSRTTWRCIFLADVTEGGAKSKNVPDEKRKSYPIRTKLDSFDAYEHSNDESDVAVFMTSTMT